MNETQSGPLGITRQPPPTRWVNRAWIALGSVLILAGLGLAGLSAGKWYLAKEVRAKLMRVADRAGLHVSVGSIDVGLNSPIRLQQLVLSSPKSSGPLLEVAHIEMQLTLAQVIMGERRPAHIHLTGPKIDLVAHRIWKNAFRAYSAVRTEKAGKARELPRLTWKGGVASFRPLNTEETITLHGLSGHLQRIHGDNPKLVMSLSGQDESARRILSTAFVDLAKQQFEIGASFDPPLSLSTDFGAKIQFAGFFLKQFHTLRFKDLKVMHSKGEIEATYLGLNAENNAPLWASPVNGEFRNLKATGGDFKARAERARFKLDAINLEDPASSFRGLKIDQLSFESSSALIALAASSSEITTQGREIKEILLTQADVSWVLPPPGSAKTIPYYRQIQAFLLGSESDFPPHGGGPSEPSPPIEKTGISLEALPKVRIVDGSLALLAGSKAETVMVVHALDAELIPIGDTLDLAVSGRLHELATGDQGRFNVMVRAKSDGRLESATVKLSGSKLASQLARLSNKIRLTDRSSLTLDLDLKPHADGGGVTIAGSIEMRDVGFYAPRIHGTLVDGLSLQTDLTADLDIVNDKLTLDMPRIVVNETALFRMVAVIERLDGRLPKLSVKLKLPKQGCQGLLDSIPNAMAPRIQGMILNGTAQAHLDFKVDLLQPRSFKWDIDINMEQCKPKHTGVVDVDRLNTEFVHEVVEKGIPTGIMVGPGTHHYRPLSRIPKHIQMGAIWTEDHSFYKHAGFRPALIRRAVVLDLEKERYIYGGSTISQQLVKNLFLSREKTLSRKLEEAVIVWLMERKLSKKRILELYLNCIEYGPNLYGINNAAQAYFGKHVSQLSPLEGAFLMGLKPYPWAGWKQLKRGFVQPWWYRRLGKILEGLNKRGWITDEELALSQPYDPVFVTSPHSAPTPPILREPEPPIGP